jgi:hypothetical protein
MMLNNVPGTRPRLCLPTKYSATPLLFVLFLLFGHGVSIYNPAGTPDSARPAETQSRSDMFLSRDL